MKQIKSRSKVPVGGYWRYVDPETKAVLRHPYLSELENLAKKHRLANNLPIGSNWSSDFDANICAQHPDLCEENEPNLLTKAQTLSAALLKWARSGFQVASDAVVQSRLDICEKCEFWQAGRKLLSSKCKACGCTGAKLWLIDAVCPKNKWS